MRATHGVAPRYEDRARNNVLKSASYDIARGPGVDPGLVGDHAAEAVVQEPQHDLLDQLPLLPRHHEAARRVKTARAANTAPARKRAAAERMEYQTPFELVAMLMPMREKTTAPSDQMSVALLVLFMDPA